MASRAVLDLVVSLKDEASDGLGRIGGAVGGLASGALTALTVGAGAAAVGLAGIGAAGVAAASSLEQEMANTAAIMGLTGEEVAELKGLVSDLGMDPNLKVSAVEAAQAIQELGAQGLTTEQIMNGAARATVLLSNATGGDMVQSATVATDAMALWNMEAAEMEAAVNSITSVANVSKFGIEDYSLALAQAGGVAAATGVDFEDFNASIAAIAPYFASGSDAGTSYKTMLQRLIPTTGPATDAFYEMGLMVNETSVAMDWLRRRGIEPVSEEWNELVTQMQKVHAAESGLTYNTKEQLEAFVALSEEIGMTHSAFFDVNGQMKDGAEIAGILNEALKDMTEEDRNRLVTQAFGTDAMRAALGLAEMTEEQFRDMMATMGETSAADAAATRMNTFAGAMEIAGGVMEALSIQIGDALLPVLRPLVESFTEFAGTAGPGMVASLEGLATTVGEALPGAFRAVSDTLAPVVAGLGELVAAFQTFQFLAQNGIAPIEAFKIALGTLVGEEMVSRLTPLIDGVGALAAKLGEIGGAVQTFAFLVQNGIAPLDAFRTALSTVLGPEAVAQVMSGIQFVIDHFDELKAAAIAMGAVFIGASVLGAVVSIGAAIAALVTPLGLVMVAVGLLAAAWEGNWGGVQQATAAAWFAISPWLEQLRYTVAVTIPQGVTRFRETWDRDWETARSTLERVKNAIAAALNNLGTFFTATIPGWLTTLQTNWNNAWTSIGSTFATIAGNIRSGIDGIVNAIGSVITRIAALASSLSSLSIPDWLTPGSPTPFENGLRGISDAMKELSQQQLPAFRAAMPGDVAVSGGAFGATSAAPVINIYNPSVRSDDDIDELAYRIQSVLQRRS